jgi:DNA gyrase subunit B
MMATKGENVYEPANVHVYNASEIRESIRKRPAMYFGDNGPGGAVHVVNELVSNGIDQFLHGKASRVGVSFDGDRIVYSDDGPGIPFDVVASDGKSLGERYFTEFHDSPTADGHAPHIHIMNFGLGLMAVNSASQSFEVRTWRAGRRWTQNYHEGLPDGPPQSKQDSSEIGTRISFRLDPTVFSVALPDTQRLRTLMFDATHLFPGITLDLGTETFHAPGGLADLVLHFRDENPSLFPFPDSESSANFGVNSHHADMQIQVGVLGDSTWPTIFRSWANGTATPLRGTHVDGLQDALQQVDWNPSVAMIHVVLQKPEFAGNIRGQLQNPEVRKLVRECLKPLLKDWRDRQSTTGS